MSLLLACLADDFTGATDALESLTLAGLQTVMFADAPSPQAVAAIHGLQAIVVATAARSWTSEESERVRPMLAALRELRPRHVVYKVCSTFDSSPQRGNIGRVIEIGSEVFKQATVPVVPGAPTLGRYAVFGNLFAAGSIASGADVYRLDRHPVMSRHPVTPMLESDLRRHLSLQTDRTIGLFDVRELSLPPAERRRAWAAAATAHAILLCDLLTVDQQAALGGLLDDSADGQAPRFSVGSSGATSSLGAYWNANDACKPRTDWPPVNPQRPILVVSGSCSAVTGRQINAALSAGWVGVDAFSPTAATDMAAVLRSGRNGILHTCIGPDDQRRTIELPDMGTRLGGIASDILANAPTVGRVVFAGGDATSHALAQLGMKTFRMITRITPGAPLCQSDGYEIVCKGGQAGPDDFFLLAAGQPSSS
ncbi:MAG: serine kinase [Pirellula sp.]|nr:serine kinase [Pirellula sp.]